MVIASLHRYTIFLGTQYYSIEFNDMKQHQGAVVLGLSQMKILLVTSSQIRETSQANHGKSIGAKGGF